MDLAILEGDAQNITIYELVPDLRGGSFVVGYHVPRGVGWWRGWDGGERWGVPDICNTCRGVVHAYHTMVGPSEWDEQIGPSCGSVVHAYYYRCLEPSTFSPHPILPTIPLPIGYDSQQWRDLCRDLGPVRRWRCSKHCLLKGWVHCLSLFPFLLWSVLLSNGLSTFSLVHLILSWHVIILSQGTLSLIYFLMRSMISLMLSQPSFDFHAVHGYASFSSLSFWCLTHHTCLCFHSMHSLLNFRTHSPGLRISLMHSVSVDLIQSCTNIMSSI